MRLATGAGKDLKTKKFITIIIIIMIITMIMKYLRNRDHYKSITLSLNVCFITVNLLF